MDEDKRIPYFLLGLGIGAAVGILFAPKAGPETRDFLLTKADEAGHLAPEGQPHDGRGSRQAGLSRSHGGTGAGSGGRPRRHD